MRAIQPVAAWGIAGFARLGIDPLHVVLIHGAFGFVAAAGIAIGGPVAWNVAAVFLIAKVLLDNIDGGLARATGRVTQTGRYLDTWVDFWNNLAIFAALSLYGASWPTVVAWAVLTLVLTVDFNLERRYRDARDHGPASAQASVPLGASPAMFRTLRGAYNAFFAPQDRAIARLDAATMQLLADRAGADIDVEAHRAWNDLFSTAAVVNLGLSTQLLALAILLVAGAPFGYVWVVLLQAPYLMCVWLLRMVRFQAYLRER